MMTRATPTIVDRHVDCWRPFSLFKVHGSVNWGRVVGSGANTAAVNPIHQVVAALIENSPQLRLTDDYVIVPPSEPAARLEASQQILVPAIAIPVQTKQAFECPPSHIEALTKRINAVRRLLIIGWRGLDQHFVKLLREHLNPSVVVQAINGSPQAADELMRTLNDSGVRAQYNAGGLVTFTD